MTLQSEKLAHESSSAAGGAASLPALRAPERGGVGDVLTMAFAITVGIWVTAYISRLPMVELPGQVTIGGMVAVIFLGGLVAGRYSAKGAWAAVGAGALSGMLDLIVLGSLLLDSKPADAAVVVLWLAGSIVLSAAVAGIGGLAGRAMPSTHRGAIGWASVFAFVLAAATCLLIAAGGFVTASRSGLAVPDWPRSFGYNMFLFPLSVMQKDSGKFFEHAHRLMGSLVGMISFALALYITFTDRRGRVKALVWAIFLGVGIQGVLGGLRVTDKSETLAIIHGAFAQVVFAAMAVLVAATSAKFVALRPSPPTQARESGSVDRALTATLVGALIVQLMLGTVLRHIGELLLIHITMAVLVTVLVLACGVRAWGLFGEVKSVQRSGFAVLALVCMQITLGVLALVYWNGPAGKITTTSLLLTTAHQVNGALLLACSAVLMAWTWRAVGKERD